MAAAQESRLEVPGVGSADPPASAAAPSSRNGKPTPHVNGNGKHPATSAGAGSDPDIPLFQQGWYLVAKDGLDRVLALLLLVVTAPLTSNESWTAFAPGELKVFVDGALARA